MNESTFDEANKRYFYRIYVPKITENIPADIKSNAKIDA